MTIVSCVTLILTKPNKDLKESFLLLLSLFFLVLSTSHCFTTTKIDTNVKNK